LKTMRNFFSKYQDVLLYLIFGGLTTLVNFLVYFPLYNLQGLSGAFSNVIAWLVAVIFAFLTNKPFVFQSYDWSVKTVLPEATKFVGCRILSGLMETLSIWMFVDLLRWNGNWIKIIVSVMVVILNFIFSKWIVFIKKGK